MNEVVDYLRSIEDAALAKVEQLELALDDARRHWKAVRRYVKALEAGQ